ncbi:MAG: GNAT family protein, partial [Clostridium perfringens]|nr:GNAT family protein [Clostridium perfringens]
MINKENIIIRAIEEEDLETIYRWNSQEFRGDFQEFQFQSLNKLKEEYSKNGFYSKEFQMLIVKEKDIKIGLVYLNFYREGIVKIGLVLNHESCNKGRGTSILKIMTEHLFNNYQIVRIEADTDVENIAAQEILSKVGFLREGKLRKYRFHHGSYHDSYIYS